MASRRSASLRRRAPSDMLLWWIPLVAAAAVVSAAHLPSPHNVSNQIRKAKALPLRVKRSAEHLIQDCVMVTSEEGHFFYKSPGGEDTPACGVFLITDPDKMVEVYIDYLDVPCSPTGGSLVSVVDGWEMNGQFFPSAEDHPKPMNQRFHEFCGSRPKQVYLSSQNAALVQYRVPKRGRGFSFHVRYIRNPTPCNILIEGTSDVYTLRNYGKHVNCSLTAVYPAQVRVLQLGVGMTYSKRNSLEVETGTIHKCDKRGMPDFVQLGGSQGLDLSTYSVVDSICGMDSLPERVVETIFCGVTTVRLVSSGEFDNAVTVQLRQAAEDDIPSASLICDL